MSQDLAEDTLNRDRMIEEARVTGINFCSAEENIQLVDAINEVIEKGGKNVPSAKIDFSDGISMVGGERETYILVRRFFMEMKGGSQSGYDDVFKQVDNQETALTTDNEDFKMKMLGYSGKEGVFQRDSFMEKFQTFLEEQATHEA